MGARDEDVLVKWLECVWQQPQLFLHSFTVMILHTNSYEK